MRVFNKMTSEYYAFKYLCWQDMFSLRAWFQNQIYFFFDKTFLKHDHMSYLVASPFDDSFDTHFCMQSNTAFYYTAKQQTLGANI